MKSSYCIASMAILDGIDLRKYEVVNSMVKKNRIKSISYYLGSESHPRFVDVYDRMGRIKLRNNGDLSTTEYYYFKNLDTLTIKRYLVTKASKKLESIQKVVYSNLNKVKEYYHIYYKTEIKWDCRPIVVDTSILIERDILMYDSESRVVSIHKFISQFNRFDMKSTSDLKGFRYENHSVDTIIYDNLGRISSQIRIRNINDSVVSIRSKYNNEGKLLNEKTIWYNNVYVYGGSAQSLFREIKYSYVNDGKIIEKIQGELKDIEEVKGISVKSYFYNKRGLEKIIVLGSKNDIKQETLYVKYKFYL